jgi:regulator of cell morphogenesis and NO signaling
MLHRKINDLVTENYNYASVLYDFGIAFYRHPEQTLSQVCSQKGLDYRQVVKSLESLQHTDAFNPVWQSCPVDIIIQYLKRTHDTFTQEKLPYMAKLIADLESEHYAFKSLVRDLQLLFPLFVEDFIHHIHEEEDTLFHYILSLYHATQGKYKTTELYYQMEQYSIQYFALDHHTHDDEMRGIRKITNNYDVTQCPDLHLQVIFEELKALERELQLHAKVEDEILFIKALQLEKYIKEMMEKKVRLN